MSIGKAIARQRKNMLSYSDSIAKVDKKLEKANGIQGMGFGNVFEGRIRGGPIPENVLDFKPEFRPPNSGFLKGRKIP